MSALSDKARQWGVDRATYVNSLQQHDRKRKSFIERYSMSESWRDDARSITNDPAEQRVVMDVASEAFRKAVKP